MDASIIVCTYNRAESLRETLVGIQTGRIADTHGWVMRV